MQILFERQHRLHGSGSMLAVINSGFHHASSLGLKLDFDFHTAPQFNPGQSIGSASACHSERGEESGRFASTGLSAGSLAALGMTEFKLRHRKTAGLHGAR